jgi:ADP-ribose pyrophosphatase
MEEKTIEEKVVYKGKVIDVFFRKVITADNIKAERDIVHLSPAVGIVPLLDDKKICLIEQYRAAIARVLLEIPAGKVNPKESLEECAKRELKEETGYRAENWKKLISFYSSPGFCDEMLTIFMARCLSKGNQDLDKDENIKIKVVTISEAKEMIKTGEIKDAKTIIGISLI